MEGGRRGVTLQHRGSISRLPPPPASEVHLSLNLEFILPTPCEGHGTLPRGAALRPNSTHATENGLSVPINPPSDPVLSLSVGWLVCTDPRDPLPSRLAGCHGNRCRSYSPRLRAPACRSSASRPTAPAHLTPSLPSGRRAPGWLASCRRLTAPGILDLGLGFGVHQRPRISRVPAAHTPYLSWRPYLSHADFRYWCLQSNVRL